MPSGAGCGQCTDADAAVARERSLAAVANIVDDSHFFVTLGRCRSCDQDYALVFCETVDWQGGNDPQYSLRIPVTTAEARSFSEAGEEGVTAARENLSPRGYVFKAWDAHEEYPSIRWVHGRITVPRHD